VNTIESELKTPARLFVVDDHPVVREGLAAQIKDHPDLSICGEAADVAEALTSIATALPDMVIIDITLKTGNGIDLVKRLKARDPAIRILVWSMHHHDLYTERALRAGALGYVNKNCAAGQIIEAILTVLAGKLYVSAEVSAKLLSRALGRERPLSANSIVESLTDRELEAFELLGKGRTTRQIAEKMHVSPKTVETYRARIKEKLKLSNSAELIQHAVQWAVERG